MVGLLVKLDGGGWVVSYYKGNNLECCLEIMEISVHTSLYIVQCIMYNVHCTLYTV